MLPFPPQYLLVRQICRHKLHLCSEGVISGSLATRRERLTQTNDHILLSALGAGDMQALAAIYDAHHAPVYHLLLAWLGEKDQAEDILVEVFLGLVDRGRSISGIRNLRAYLLKIARNKASQARHRSRNSPSNQAVAVAESPVERKLDALTVRDALAQLPGEQAEVVVLKTWHELTFAEIGEVLDVPANTAASRYRYGLAKLREILGETSDE